MTDWPAGIRGLIKSLMNVWTTVFQARAATRPKALVQRTSIWVTNWRWKRLFML